MNYSNHCKFHIAISTVKFSCAIISSWLDPVPPNATVIFEVEAFSVSRGPRSMEAFGNMDLDNDKSLTKNEVPVIYRLLHHLVLTWVFAHKH